MIDDLDIRLRTSFRSAPLPRATENLRDVLERLPLDAPVGQPARVGRLRPLGLMAAGLAGIALVAVAVGLGTGPRGVGPIGPSDPPSPSPSPSASPSESPRPTDPTFPLVIVSVLLEDRADGRVGGEQVVLSGFWTDRRIDEPCSTVPPSPLIIGCQDGRFGVTDEGSVGEWVDGAFIPTGEPVLTPYIAPDVLGSEPFGPLLAATAGLDPPARPVHVFLLGHFDDPAAADCPEAVRRQCLDRFVVEELYSVDDPDRPLPTPTPSTGAFPFDSPPPPPFPAERCVQTWTGGEPTDPAPTIRHLGWIPSTELELDREPFVPLPEAVYVIVTENEVPLSLWGDDPESGERVRRWGRGVCYGWANSGTWYGAVPGTIWKVWEDGRRVPIDSLIAEPESPAP